jgi:hypothetical protein
VGRLMAVDSVFTLQLGPGLRRVVWAGLVCRPGGVALNRGQSFNRARRSPDLEHAELPSRSRNERRRSPFLRGRAPGHLCVRTAEVRSPWHGPGSICARDSAATATVRYRLVAHFLPFVIGFADRQHQPVHRRRRR